MTLNIVLAILAMFAWLWTAIGIDTPNGTIYNIAPPAYVAHCHLEDGSTTFQHCYEYAPEVYPAR